MIQVSFLQNALVPQDCVPSLTHACSIRELAPTDWQTPFLAFVDGHPVLRADWELVLEDGQSVAFVDVRAIPQGGGGGSSDPLRTLLMIGLVMIAGPLGAALGPGAAGSAGLFGLSAATWTSAIMIGGMALINAIIPPPKATSAQIQSSLAAASPTYSLQAQGNSARLEAAIPEHFGRMIAYPDFASQPFQEFVGNEQYLYHLLCLGRGSYDIESVMIEDTDISSFNEITYEVIEPYGTSKEYPTNVISSVEVSGQTLDCSTATYTQSGTTVTVTLTAHGLYTAKKVYLQINSGTTPSGEYTVTDAPTADTFTVTSGSRTASGGVYVSPYVGGFIANTAGSLANYLGIDLGASKGLYYANDDGSLGTKTISVSAEARTVNDLGVATGSWATLVVGTNYSAWSDWSIYTNPALQTTQTTSLFGDKTIQGVPANTLLIEYMTDGNGGATYRTRTVSTGVESMSGATTTPQRYSFRYAVAAGRYEVRMRRVDVEDTNTRAGHAVVWGGLRAYISGADVYGDVTLLAVRMRASNNLSSQSSRKLNVIATRKLPIWNGSSWSAPTATRSIAWAMAYVAKQAGLSDMQIDLASLKSLQDTYWTPRGDNFDARFDNFLTFWEAVSKVATAGRAKPYMQGGVMRVHRDSPATIPVAMYSMRNILKGSFSVDYLMPTEDTADAVNVTYFDSTVWASSKVLAKLPDSIAETPAKVELFGVTNRDHAYREGMYHNAVNRYRRKLIKFSTEMEGFIPSFGSLITVQHDMPGWGQGGEVEAWDAGTNKLTLSEPSTFTTGTHYLALRKRDGSVAGPYVVTATADPYVVQLASSPSFTPYTGGTEERTHFAFGAADTWSQKARVVSVAPQGLNQVAIQAVAEDDNVHTAETGTTTPVLVTSYLRASEADKPVMVSAEAYPMKGNANVMLVSWEPVAWASSYVIEQSEDGKLWTRCGETSTSNLVTSVVYGNKTIIRIAAVGLSQGPWLVVQPDTTPPSDVATFTYSQTKIGIDLAWASVIDPALESYEVREGATWETGVVKASPWGTNLSLGLRSAGSFKVLIKALDTGGNYSVNAASVTVAVVGPATPIVSLQLVDSDEIISWTAGTTGFATDRYEIRYGASWAAGIFLDTTKATSLRRYVDYSATRTYWVAAIDVAGNIGSAGAISSSIVAPSPVVSTRADVIDNNVLIYWQAGAYGLGQLPVVEYAVRKGATWAVGSVVGSNGNSTFASVFEQEAGTFTYWVAPIDSGGTVGDPRAIVANVSQPPDYVLRNAYSSNLFGTVPGNVTRTVTNFYIESGALVGPVNTASTWASHFTGNSWTTPSAQVSAGYPVYAQPGLSTGVFEEIIDYGAVLPATVVTANLATLAVAGTVEVTCTISYKVSAGDAWTVTATGNSRLLPSFRFVRVHFDLAASTPAGIIQITSLAVRLDIKQRSDSGAGVSAVGGVAMTFGYPFVSADTPIVQAAGLDAFSKPYAVAVIYVGASYPTGFSVRIFNSAGTEVSGVPFSWTVRGY